MPGDTRAPPCSREGLTEAAAQKGVSGSAVLASRAGSDGSPPPTVCRTRRGAVRQEAEQALHMPSHCLSCLLSSISDPFIFNMCSKDRSSDHYSCQSHSYGDLRELRQARFLLQVSPGEGAGGPGASEAPSVRDTLCDPLHTCAQPSALWDTSVSVTYVGPGFLVGSFDICFTLSPVPAIWLLEPSLSWCVI